MEHKCSLLCSEEPPPQLSLPWAGLIQCMPSHPVPVRQILIMSFHLRLYTFVFFHVRSNTPVISSQLNSIPSHSARYTVSIPSHGARYTVSIPSHSERYTVSTPSHSERYTVSIPSHSARYTVSIPSHSARYTVSIPSPSARYTSLTSHNMQP